MLLRLRREHLYLSLPDSVQVQDGLLLMTTEDAREATVSVEPRDQGGRGSSMEDQPRTQVRKEPVSCQVLLGP